VKSAINLEVVSVTPENINAGGSGYVTLKLKNSGADTGKKAIAKLSRSGNSPVVPVDSTVYIGTFEPGQEVDAKFKVSVSKDGEPQEYPLSVLISYENNDGETLDTPAEDFGIPVGAKVAFTVTSPASVISPGQKGGIEVTYRNDGDATAYSAEARISAVDPFTSNDDLAFLGDIKPGESGTAKFVISTAADATKKSYGLDSEVRYRDALDNSQISDTVKIPVSVVASGGIGSLLGNPIVLALLLVIILGAGYYLYTRRQKKQVR
ncbi:MAG: S-layer protein, partial [Methanobacteriota archaeon]